MKQYKGSKYQLHNAHNHRSQRNHQEGHHTADYPHHFTDWLLHTEKISLYISSPKNPIILGHLWLATQDHIIVTNSLKLWTPFPVHNQQLRKPQQDYTIQEYTEQWDCIIELLHNTAPPKSKVYPISIPETQAMDKLGPCFRLHAAIIIITSSSRLSHCWKEIWQTLALRRLIGTQLCNSIVQYYFPLCIQL